MLFRYVIFLFNYYNLKSKSINKYIKMGACDCCAEREPNDKKIDKPKGNPYKPKGLVAIMGARDGHVNK
mgnify:CR=1 FL=1